MLRKFENEVADGRSTEETLNALSECEDIMPGSLCADLDVPSGSTFKQGVASIREAGRVAGEIREGETRPGKKNHTAHAHAKGFSLIELLIVVAIILIIAAIAIPRLLQARTTAVEARAGTAMRTIGTGLVGYNTKWAAFPPSLSDLGGAACDTTAPTSATACLMDNTTASQLATPGVGQYVFTYATNAGAFTLNGDPISSSAAKRHFFMDTGLTVHYSDTASAAATDPTL